jgi:hypothetical protein
MVQRDNINLRTKWRSRAMDRFLTEIYHVHDLHASIRRLSDAERLKPIRTMVDVEGVDSEAGDWIFDARGAQVPPRDLDWAWLFLGGRGTGKTRAASACVHMAVRAGIKRIHLIGPTVADLHDVNLTGPSGIMRTAGRRPIAEMDPLQTPPRVAKRRSRGAVLRRRAGIPARASSRTRGDR